MAVLEGLIFVRTFKVARRYGWRRITAPRGRYRG